MSKKIKIAVVGAGHLGRFHARLLSKHPDYELLAVVDPSLPARTSVAEEVGVKRYESIDSLPEREKVIVTLYYVEEMNLREIGAVLEVSESRVSQLLTSTIKKLRAHLNPT